MELVVQQLVNALSLGGIYALLALGLAIVFSIMGMVNFAHGEIMTLGGYAMWVATAVFGMPLPLVLAAALLTSMTAAVVMERVAFRPVRGSSGATMLLTSFAVSIILQVTFQNLISPRPRGIQLPPEMSQVIPVFGIGIGLIQLTAIVLVLISLGLITLFLRRSTLGISMRAAAQDFSVARLMGIRADGVIATAFAISGLLAGMAAFLYVAQRGSVEPAMGLTPVIKAFIASVMGGLGSLPGAVLGGFVLGFIEVTLQAWLPQEALPFKDAVALAIVMGSFRRRQLPTKILSGLPELQEDGKGGRLLTEGMYARVRHPRYLEVVAAVFGYAALANYTGGWIMALAVLPALHLVVLLEERELERRFGAEYLAYRARVPRYVPRRRAN